MSPNVKVPPSPYYHLSNFPSQLPIPYLFLSKSVEDFKHPAAFMFLDYAALCFFTRMKPATQPTSLDSDRCRLQQYTFFYSVTPQFSTYCPSLNAKYYFYLIGRLIPNSPAPFSSPALGDDYLGSRQRGLGAPREIKIKGHRKGYRPHCLTKLPQSLLK